MSGNGSSFLSFSASSTKNIWIIDSGAIDHMTPYSSYFHPTLLYLVTNILLLLTVPIPPLLVVVTSTFNLPFL